MQVKDGADRNEVSCTELEQSYKWARNDIYIYIYRERDGL